jgi:hypothetical protein
MSFWEKATPVISGLFGLGSNIASNIGSKRRERDARKFNERMEKDRRAYDTKQWERQLAYNHPLQQMQRLTDAGLNPNLIYGSSPGSAVGNASQSPTGKAVTGQAPSYSIDNPMVPFMNAKVQQAQANNMNTSAMKNIAGANLSDAQTNRLNSLLASEVTIHEEQAKRASMETFIKEFEKEGVKNHYAAKVAAEAAKAIADGKLAEAKIPLAELNKELAKLKIRPQDPLYLSILARVYGIASDKYKDIVKGAKNFYDKWIKD